MTFYITRVILNGSNFLEEFFQMKNLNDLQNFVGVYVSLFVIVLCLIGMVIPFFKKNFMSMYDPIGYYSLMIGATSFWTAELLISHNMFSYAVLVLTITILPVIVIASQGIIMDILFLIFLCKIF